MDMQITGSTSGYWTLVATTESNIKSPADLKGKKIAIITAIIVVVLIIIGSFGSNDSQTGENNDAGQQNVGVVDNNNNEVVDFVPGPGKILAVTPTGAETKIALGDEIDGNNK